MDQVEVGIWSESLSWAVGGGGGVASDFPCIGTMCIF